MSETPTSLKSPPPAAAGGGKVLIAIDGGSPEGVTSEAQVVTEAVERAFPGRPAVVLASDRAGHEVRLASLEEFRARSANRQASFGSLSAGGIPGSESSLLALLRRAAECEAAALALVAGEAHDPGIDWVGLLLRPVLEDGFDYVCPAYRRNAMEGALVTGIVYPLTRSLYGQRLRQPLGGEAALLPAFARTLLGDEDWDLDPLGAGSDPWLVAKALAGGRRVCQAWLGSRARRPSDHDDPSHVLARTLGLVFREMERHASHWQRVSGSRIVPTYGEPGFSTEEPARVNPEPLVASFRQGLRDLQPIWALVLSPATMMALRRAGSQAAETFRLEDTLWVRVVQDFAVAHLVRVIDRGQLLRSMTPLYLAWVASHANEVRSLDPAGAEQRVERLCECFEREKPYLIGRWRWPDRFNP